MKDFFNFLFKCGSGVPTEEPDLNASQLFEMVDDSAPTSTKDKDKFNTPERLLYEATQLFAQKGFAATSTREICHAACVNPASIHYYFGDKNGLYKSVHKLSIDTIWRYWPKPEDISLPLPELMRKLIRPFVFSALKESEMSWLMKIHLREMLDPTPIIQDMFTEFTIQPLQTSLMQMLAHHCGADVLDAELKRLLSAIIALAKDYCWSKQIMQNMSPELFEDTSAYQQTLDRLTRYACALVRDEAERRQSLKIKSARSCRISLTSVLKYFAESCPDSPRLTQGSLI